MHVKSILHEFGTCKIDFTYIRYYLAAKIDFTGFPILAAPEMQSAYSLGHFRQSYNAHNPVVQKLEVRRVLLSSLMQSTCAD